MLTRVQIKNFRCLRDVDVPLKPLTVLIGPNNTGKSSFLSAIEILGTVSPSADNISAISASDIMWGLDQDASPSITGLEDDKRIIVERGFGDRSHSRGIKWTRTATDFQIVPISLFNCSMLSPAMQSPGAAEKVGIPLLDDNVSNIPAFLDALLRKDRDRFDKIVKSLRILIPGFKNLNIETPSANDRRIDLVHEDGMTMEAKLASHGVKLMIFFVALANHPNPPKSILIEEPETGVHPKRLEDIVKLLRGLSEGVYAEYATQVILSTHSPYLLDYIDLEMDQVLVFERDADGSRNAKPVDAKRLEMFRHEFMLGEIWMNQEEAGLVGKSQ